MGKKFGTVDEYVASFNSDVQDVLNHIRDTIRVAVPGVTEKISYQMLAMLRDGKPVAHVAAWKKHIGMYPVPRYDGTLGDECEHFRATKDTLHFPYAKPIPYDLIGRLALRRVAENGG